MSKILCGTDVVDKYKDYIKKEIQELETTPTLAIIVAKDYSGASSVYVRNKHKMAEELGIRVIEYTIEWENVEANVFTNTLVCLINSLNNDDDVDGIIVQLPIPFISDDYIASLIDPKKDVDGFNPYNLGGIVRGNAVLNSCTPQGAMLLLDHYNIQVSGKICCVVGRSNILGKPLSNMLINKGGTVITCNSKTPNLKAMTKLADIVFLCTGNTKMFDSSYFKDGAIAIDFGMNRDENGKLCGDLDVEDAQSKLSGYTPTPKGTGPLTVLVLMLNTLLAHKNKKDTCVI